ncbi:MAG: ATP-binding protein [Pirellulaceae bacterium]
MTVERLKQEIADLRRRVKEAEDTIAAIRGGEVDAFVVQEGVQHRVYTLEGADRPYRILVERMQQGAATLTMDGEIAYCNRRFAEMLGVPHEQLLGRHFLKFVPDEERERCREMIEKGVLGSAEAETRICAGGNESTPVYMTLNVLDPDSGVAVGLLLTDLTQQQSHEQLRETTHQLRVNEERYRTLFQSIDEGFGVLELIFDENGRCNNYRFVEVNPAFEKHTGLSNAVGRTVRDLVPDIESHWCQTYERVLKTGVATRFIDESVAMSRVFNVYAFRLGEVEDNRVAVLFNDISEQRRIEMDLRRARVRLQSTLDAAEIGTWDFDLAENRVFADENLAEMFGLLPADANGGPLEAYMRCIHPEDVERVKSEVRQAIDESNFYESSYRLIGEKEEDVRYVVARGRVQRDNAGTPISLPGVVIDITAQRLAEERLRQVAASLEEADRRKNLFLATLAHELRNPLSPIKSAAQMMQLPDIDPQQFREFSGVIDRQVDQMVRLIDDLLDVSRISRGKITLRREPVDLRKVVSMALEAAAPFIDKSQQRLHVRNTPDSLWVEGDAARLTQVIANLLNNAAKYTPAAGDVWLEVHRQNEQAIISVRDNGIGLDPEAFAKIFEMFEQVDVSKERGQSGLGIGLSLAKTLVELHNGSISVHSDGVNKGCRFDVTLPLLVDYVPKKIGEPLVSSEASDQARAFRILVVEDTRAIRFMLVQILRKMGHEVSEACDGEQGLQAAIQSKPQIILSDISMPNMNGHDMARRIREHPDLKNVILVALTGFGQEADRANAIESGFDDHLVKPVDIRILQAFLKGVRLE